MLTKDHSQLSFKVGPLGNGYKSGFKAADRKLKQVGCGGTGTMLNLCIDVSNLLLEVMGVAKPVMTNEFFTKRILFEPLVTARAQRKAEQNFHGLLVPQTT